MEFKTTFNTVEDMMAYAKASPRNAERRFTLEETSHRVWDVSDEVVLKWEEYKEKEETKYPYPYLDKAKYPTQESKDRAESKWHKSQERIDARRPKSHQEYFFYLNESREGGHGHYFRSEGVRIALSRELGSKIVAMWPTRDRYNGRRRGMSDMVRCGRFTVSGLVKKLDPTVDVKGIMKQAKDNQVEDLKRIRRNNKRKQMISLAHQMIECMFDGSKTTPEGIIFPDGQIEWPKDLNWVMGQVITMDLEPEPVK